MAFQGFKSILIAGALIAVSALPTAASASYSAVYVFGDSLADSGNLSAAFGNFSGKSIYTPTPLADPVLIPAAPYAVSNKFSNGDVWVEQFAKKLGLSATASLLGGTNYAFAGARVNTFDPTMPPSLVMQMQQYLYVDHAGVASNTALHVVEGGGNDARDVIGAALMLGDMGAAMAAADQYAKGVASIVSTLKSAGAGDILVWNTPDVGKIPFMQDALGANAGVASFLVAQMNGLLTLELSKINTNGVKIFDAFTAFNEIWDDPSAYGFTNMTTACAATASCIASPKGSFFWDGIHPTTEGHALLAEMAYRAVPEPAVIFLMAFALMALGLSRRSCRN